MLATELRNQVATALEQIHPDNGFRTDAGLRVRQGRIDRLRRNEAVLPMIAMQTVSNAVGTVNRAKAARTLEILISGIVDATEHSYTDALDALDADILAALMPLTEIDAMPRAMRVDITGGDYSHPQPADTDAGVSFAVQIAFAQTQEAQT